MLGVPQAYAPEADCLAEGLTLFEHNHRARFKNPSALRILAGLGRELWAERLKAMAVAKSPLLVPLRMERMLSSSRYFPGNES